MNTNKGLAQMAQEIDQHLRAIRRTLRQPTAGLTGPQRGLLDAVIRSGGLSLKDASRQLGLAHSTVSGIVDRLAKQGFVNRQTDRKDHRVSLIVASKVAPALHCPLTDALRRAKPAERKSILEGVRALRRAVK